MSILEKHHFVCTQLEKNSNKFWIIELHDDKRVLTHYGRVGQDGYRDNKSFDSQAAAEKYFRSKLRDKAKVKERRDAYTEINIIGETKKSTNIASRHISDIAVKQIKTSSQEVRDFIKFLSDVNIHNITSSTSIKYNVSEGSFTTPLGVVDQNCIDTAKDLLDKISVYVKSGDLSNKDFLKLVNSYLRYIPQDLGGSHTKIRIADVLGTLDKLQNQANIIEGLQAAIQNSKPAETIEEKIFDVQIEKDNHKIDPTWPKNTQNAYTLFIDSVTNAYNQYGNNLDNKKMLWHGTNPANILSIFKQGLIIPKTYSNGWMYGPGIYFSDRIEKSLQYATSNNGKKYLFRSEVAMGETIFDNNNNILKKGQSRWASKDSYNSQIIIFNPAQCKLLYLLEIF